MHPKLQKDWAPPVGPAKYPELTAVLLTRQFGQAWHLDFSRKDSKAPFDRFFASDADCCPPISWPWVENFAPQPDDWRAAGFVVLELEDASNDIRLDTASTRKSLASLIAASVGARGATLH